MRGNEWIDPSLQIGDGEYSIEEIVNNLFELLSETVDDGKHTWMLNPAALNQMKDSFIRLRGCFDEKSVSMKFIPFDPDVERGMILITRNGGDIVCNDTETFASVCRAKGCQGFDMTALKNGTTEITVSFLTGREVR